MSVNLLLREFDRATDAPDAMLRLRRFVLDLAVRGKLTERSSDDEPASTLLSRIQRQLDVTISRSSRRKSVRFEPITASEAPFSVPEGWIWTRVRQITRDRGQTVPTSAFTYIDVTAIDKELGRLGAPVIMSATEAPSRARKIVSRGDVLYSCVRPYLLNIAVIEHDLNPLPIASTAFAVLDGAGLVEPRYLWTVLRSPYFVECVEEKMRGLAYPAINDSDFSQLPVPLPPLAEQRRIVGKVEELMTLCDQLEAAQQEREVHRDDLRSASLHRLTSTEGVTELRKDFDFFLESSQRLITKAEHVTSIRKTILHLAVTGRLRNVEGASSHERQPIHSVASLQNGYAFKSEWFQSNGIRLLRNVNVGHGDIEWTSRVCLPESMAEEFTRFSLAEGDIVVSLDRPFITTGTKVAIVRKHDLPCLLLQRVGRFQIDEERIDARYLCLWVQSPSFSLQIDPGRSNGVPHVSSKQIESAELLLPSLEEQRRIVSEVDLLMKVCTELESALALAQIERVRLLESLLHSVAQGTSHRIVLVDT